MHTLRRAGLACALALGSSSVALFVSCGGGDETSGETGNGDSGSDVDATAKGDGSIGIDGSPGDSETSDANVDTGPPPHVVFATTATYQGNLVFEANTGAAGTLTLPDGGAFVEYRSAADAICTYVGHSAGFVGPFTALLQAGTDNVFVGLSNSDGAWSLVDGTPVADSVVDLSDGDYHAPINRTENGAEVSGSGNNFFPWTMGTTNNDCDGWTSNSMAKFGEVGSSDSIGFNALFASSGGCNDGHPLVCAQTGPGGGSNIYPPVGSSKLAFVAAGPYAANFTVAGVLDAGVGSGDQVHLVGDAICNEVAAGLGRTGTYRAWVSSTATSAFSYFNALSMNGPWVRPDGFVVASSASDLTTNGPKAALSLQANGQFASNLSSSVLTGTLQDGGIGQNCLNFTDNTASHSADLGFITSGPLWTASTVTSFCSNASQSVIDCFEQ